MWFKAVMKPKTPIAQVYKASGLTMKEFADDLGMSQSVVEKYCSGDMKLPDKSKLEVLWNKFGVDIDSLYPREDGKTGWALTVTGQRISKDYCSSWGIIGEMGKEEVELATKQLSGMIWATLLCCSGSAPHMTEDEIKRVQKTSDTARIIVTQLHKCFANPEFGKHTPLPAYQKGKDLLKFHDDLPCYDKGWAPWVEENIPPELPIEVTLIVQPTYGLPNQLLLPQQLTPEVMRNWKKYGFGTSCLTLNTYKISSPQQPTLYYSEKKAESAIAGFYFSDTQCNEPDAVPESKPRRPKSKSKKLPPLKSRSRPTS